MGTVFDALGDGTRRRILEVLAGGEQPAGVVADTLQAGQPISQPAVSQHLKVLLEAGLVAVRAEGNRRYYALDHEGLDAAQTWLARIADPAAPFTQALDALATEVTRGKRQRKQERGSGRARSAEAG